MDHTCVDRGGTFTDVVKFSDKGRVQIRKIPSDKAVVGDLVEGSLVLGTTVATNALLERTGVDVLLLTTQGLTDLIWLGDTTRPRLFDPRAERSPPLAARVHGIAGRIAADGEVIQPLALPETLDLTDIKAIAIVLLHGPANPAHELELAAHVQFRYPNTPVSLGHQVDPAVGLLARIHTTLVHASLTPVLQSSLLSDRIPDDALAIRSDASLTPAADLTAPQAVLSGPAGGVLGVAAVAELAGFERAVGLDMGGTSTDVCRVDRGRLPRRAGHIEVAGVQLRQSMLEVHTIAAGGGSILRSDGLRLSVGPDSAGADPGPQCYGRGGPPTLTDAAVHLGLVDPLAFTPPLNPTQIDLPGPAQGFLDLARETMAAAVMQLAAEHGVDLQDHALVSYGGAAGQHAASVAERLGISTVLVHPCAAVLSAWGQRLSRREDRALTSVWAPLHTSAPQIQGWVSGHLNELERLGEHRVWVHIRPKDTDHPLIVPWTHTDTQATLTAAFAREHYRIYGFHPSVQALELVQVEVRTLAPKPPIPRDDSDPFGLGEERLSGPRLLTSPTTSVWIPDGWLAHRAQGVLRLDHAHKARKPDAKTRTPTSAALWASRFMSVAERAGETLRRLARSVNIRERRDFSCAIFDPQGHLVANAPHIPVHLGAMGDTVRDVLRNAAPVQPGQSWLCNDPDAGGSHLPDLTLVTAVAHEGALFFVACRGHHADVGGSTPGSMPPHSRSLSEEGQVFRRLPLLKDGVLRPDLLERLAGSRQPQTVLADLRAQLASNHHAASLLVGLGPADVLIAWMDHLQDIAAEAVDTVIRQIEPGEAEDTLDAVDLRVRIHTQNGRLKINFSGTGGPHARNLNAPSAVVRAAALYALRVLTQQEIPLNEGVLRKVDLIVPKPSILCPPSGCAVAGGNVETSQRLVDLILRATGTMAFSAGSMSNLTLGGEGWSFYETLAGGSGASPLGPGVSARQAHMTNTRTTDPEVLERRLPLRLTGFELRRGSGGVGSHDGGDGLVREIEVLAPTTAALLAAHRPSGATSIHGGTPGKPGSAQVCISGEWTSWNGTEVQLSAGDRVRVLTPGGGAFSASSTPQD